MKKLLTLTNIIGAAAIMCGLVGCSTTATMSSSATQKETMLSQAGFKSIAVTTAAHQQQINKLPAGQVSAVKNQGKLCYVYPTANKSQILVGKQAHFDAYKKALSAQPDTGAYLTRETAGPYHIQVDTFDGFGPIQDNPAWQ